MNQLPTMASIREHLNAGGTIAYPTEGVWGLGCDPHNKAAVMRILQIKGREVEKGLILVASNLQQIHELISPLPQAARTLLKQSCPGPDTWLIPDPNQVIPSWIKGSFSTVAVRVSQHPLVKALCDECGLLVSTSANPAGSDPAMSQAQVEAYFGAEDIRIVPGDLGGQDGPSRIIDLQSQQVLRA
jgi:L-threonylcarbamoyladenylate synthase